MDNTLNWRRRVKAQPAFGPPKMTQRSRSPASNDSPSAEHAAAWRLRIGSRAHDRQGRSAEACLKVDPIWLRLYKDDTMAWSQADVPSLAGAARQAKSSAAARAKRANLDLA